MSVGRDGIAVVSVPALRLAPAPAPAPLPPLDDVQRAAVERAPGAGHVLVVGAPGTGKTTTAMAVFERRLLASGRGAGLDEPVVLLVPGRRAAARIRDELSTRLGRTVRGLRVRTPAAFAHSILRARAAQLGEPAPTLVTGPEQDALLAELLAGHREGVGRAPRWPREIAEDTLALRAFRAELRDLLNRAAEIGLEADELAEVGRLRGRPEWTAAAAVQREYEQVLRLGELTPDRGERLDSARVLDAAVAALRGWSDDLPDVPPPRVGTVVVDDYQDATLATARLLRALADDGAELVLLGDADAGVQGFRGGTAALVRRATSGPTEPGGFDAEEVVLTTAWRQRRELRSLTRSLTRRLPATGSAGHRDASAPEPAPEPATEATPEPDGEPTGVEVAVLRTRPLESAFVARVLREEHVHHGTPWSRMAVVVRSTSQAAALRRTLSAAGVPVAVEAGEFALRDAPAVQPLLRAAEVAVTQALGEGAARAAALDATTAVELLLSPVAGPGRLDAVSLRALRRALRAEAATGGDGRGVEDLLLDALAEPARCATLPAAVRRAPERVARVLAAGREAAVAPGAGAEDVLWALWDAAGLAEPWRRAALAGGPAGERADRDLDAVLALFRAAEQFTDRNPAAGPLEFLRHLAAQDVPADSLAATGRREDETQVRTAAGAAGEEWDVVVVAGVQEDVWPDLRVRGSLLGAVDLLDVATGRSAAPGRDLRAARQEVAADELRAFVVAVSRARRRLVVTAVSDGELAPSAFLSLVAADPAVARSGEREDGEPLVRDVPAPLDLRGLVARLRGELPDGPDAPAAAALLARLARAGVPGADPEQWWSTRTESTAESLWPQEGVTLSPSAVGTADACALRWALEHVGGRPAGQTGQSLGILVHEIAQEHPHGSHATLAAELDRRWPELGLADGWVARRERARADAIIRRLAAYLASRPGEVTVEEAVDAVVGSVRLVGRVDRLEAVGDGVVRVVDLKTSASAVSVADALTDAQIGSYQAAIRAGALGPGVEPGGGALVYLGTPTREASVRVQPPLADTWAEELLDRVGEAVSGATFVATVGPRCRTCPVTTSCPAQAEGERVQP